MGVTDCCGHHCRIRSAAASAQLYVDGRLDDLSTLMPESIVSEWPPLVCENGAMCSEGEWWDVLDAQGAQTGDSFLRGAANWPRGRFHLIVAVCVQREDGAVLLTQRSASKKEFPFAWEFPGGSALSGESSRDAASRELREEAGIDVSPSALTFVGRFAEASALLDFYIARHPSNVELTLQQSEVMAAEWVTPQVVVCRLSAGVMADPWNARLDSLWLPATRALDMTAERPSNGSGNDRYRSVRAMTSRKSRM